MIWDEARWNHDLLAFYRDMVSLRRRSKTLQQGGFQMLLVDEDTFAYQREGVDRWFLVVAHRSEGPRPAGDLRVEQGGVPDGTFFVEHFSGHKAWVENGCLPLPEHPQGATLWESRR